MSLAVKIAMMGGGLERYFMGVLTGAQSQNGRAVAVDALGAIHLGVDDSMPGVVKLSRHFAIDWQQGVVAGGSARRVVLSPDGDAVLCGLLANDQLVMKFTSAGSLDWVLRLGESFTDRAFDVARASDGALYVAGDSFNGTAATFAKITDGGSVTYTRSLSAGAGQECRHQAVVVDAAGEYAYAAGRSYDGSRPALHVVKYDTSDGSIVWQRQLDLGGVPSEARSIAMSPDGSRLYVAGVVFSTTRLILLAVDTDGDVIWQRKLTGGGAEFAQGVACDAAGEVYVVGSTGNDGGLIARYSAAGVLRWQRSVEPIDSFSGVAVTASALYAIGDLNPDQHGGSDVFLLKAPLDGTRKGTYAVAGVDVTYGDGSASDAAESGTLDASSLTGGSASLSSASVPDPSAMSLTAVVTSI